MSLPAHTNEPVTLYNVVDRFNLIQREMRELNTKLEDLKFNAHPAILDLFLAYSMINVSVKGLSATLDRSQLKNLTANHLKALADLEANVYHFRDTVHDAHKELVGQ